MKIWFTQMAKPFHGERTTERLVIEWISGDSEQRSFTMGRITMAGLLGWISKSDAKQLGVGNENDNKVVPFGNFFSSELDCKSLVVHVGDLVEVDGNELSGVCLLEIPDSLKNVVSYVPLSKCKEYKLPYDSSMNDDDSSPDDDDGNYEEYESGAEDENGEKKDVKVAAVIPKMLPFSYNDGKTLPHDDEYYTVSLKFHRQEQF